MGRHSGISRRRFLKSAAAAGILAAGARVVPAFGWNQAKAAGVAPKEYDLAIQRTKVAFDDRTGYGITVNGEIPGPLLRFREGQEAIIRVRNTLQEDTSVHWHGILLPENMDGVPGVSFAGIG